MENGTGNVDVVRQREASWWTDYADCEQRWPWHLLVISESKVATLSGDKISAPRIHHLLEVAHTAAYCARMADSPTFVHLMNPAGGWRRHEREFCKRLFDDPPAFSRQSFVDSHVLSGLKLPPFLQPSANQNDALRRVAMYLGQINQPATWSVPYSEWTFIQDDFRPCLAFRVSGQIGCALHRPTASRTTPYLSVCAWRAKLLVQQVRASYQQDSQFIESVWRFTNQSDPVYRFLLLPTAESHREAKLFLETERIRQQHKHPRRLRPGINQTFAGTEIVFYSDRVEIAGALICRGTSTTRRIVLELLARRRNAQFVNYSGKNLENAAKQHGAKGNAQGWIRDLRNDISQCLQQAGIAAGHKEVIMGGGIGYRFSPQLTVRFISPPWIGDIGDISDRGHVPNSPPNVPDPHVSKSLERRQWITEQIKNGLTLKVSDVMRQFRCTKKTALRDLGALKQANVIVYQGSSRNGFYRAAESGEST